MGDAEAKLVFVLVQHPLEQRGLASSGGAAQHQGTRAGAHHRVNQKIFEPEKNIFKVLNDSVNSKNIAWGKYFNSSD